MRILVTGKDVTAAHRQIVWMLRAGCTVLFVGSSDPYEGPSRANYHFLTVTGYRHGDEQASLRALKGSLSWANQEFQPDIVHAHGLGIEARACAEVGFHPLVLSAQGFLNDLAHDPTAPLSSRLESLVLAADALVVTSPAVAKAAGLRFCSGPRLFNLTQGIDTRHFRPVGQDQRRQWRQNLGVDEDAFLMLSPRGWAEVYQHGLIVRAWAMARPRYVRPGVLAFTRMGRNSRLGSAEQCFDRVMAEVESLGLRDDIRTLPAMPQVLMPGLYGASDAIVSYPASDALGSTLLEALACECPVISARLPGYAGSVLETACRMVAPLDVQGLAEVMVEVVNQPAADRGEELRAARETVIEQLDESRSVAELLRLYRDVLA